MILNIYSDTFGHIRMGDLVAVCNAVEHLRKNNPNIKFYMSPGSIDSSDHVQRFFDFLLLQTNYFSGYAGNQDLPWKRVNLWDFRAISGDLVKIQNTSTMQNKVVICPLFDAPYNTYRNWPKQVFIEQVEKHLSDVYRDWEKIICISNKSLLPQMDYKNFKISTDFMNNINHIMTCRKFVGGDTGTSHFAWSLDRGPETLEYVMSNRGLIHTTPFYLMKGKGEMKQYWLDFERTIW